MSTVSTRDRIAVLGWVFAAGLAVVALHLWFLMVHDHAEWSRRSYENRWSFRSVPSLRGTVHDRFGRALAWDEPSTELTLHYERFRLRHPVGAAVHAATTWARQQPGGEGTTYDYLDGALGPAAAARDLLAMPVRVLRPRALPKEVAAELAGSATTVLSACARMPRTRVFRALRLAAQDGVLAVGDVLPLPRSELLARFERMLADLAQLDEAVRTHHQQRLAASGLPPEAPPALFGTLEELRRACLAGAVVTWEEPVVDEATGEERMVRRTGSRIESVPRTFADHVPFDLAAELRAMAADQPGIEVHAAVARQFAVAERTPLRVLLGQVVDLDRAEPDPDWLSDYLGRELPPDWLDAIVPEGLLGDDVRAQWQQDARGRYADELRRRERRGVTGIEAAFDDALTGRLGLRFVEHDRRRREQRLWSHLRVEAGEHVQLTLDLDLQRAAERSAHGVWQRLRELHADPADRERVEAAIAVIDARSGDVLAYGAADVTSPAVRNLPGVWWGGNGALGSVVKPFVLVEQLQSEAVGRPHRALGTLESCSGRFRYGGVTLRCSHAHWDGGKDAVEALAESCNVFYYQCGIGLGEPGVARALRRFGLEPPADAQDPYRACWQPTVRGLRVARPTPDHQVLLPQRAVGYGVQASPLHVARAYAALATGWLPTLGLLPEPRPVVVLDGVDGELELVRRGLRACVQHGTARHLELLDELQVHGKTGTAEVGPDDENNAWFAGYLPAAGAAGVQLCFAAVVYWVPDRVHGGDAAGQLVRDLLADVHADPELNARYLAPAGGR